MTASMNNLADFHFLRPLWLLGLPVLALLLWRLHRQKAGQGDWAALCDPWLLPHVIVARPGRARRHGLALLGLGGTLGLLALSGPTWEREPTPAFRNEQALVIALDLSRSMDSPDVKPTRLERARFKIVDLLQARRDGQTALVAYAGDAFTVTPLTDDGETIRAQLGALTTAIMPEQGNRADLALRQSEQLLRQAGLRQGHVLLISDGVEGDAPRQAAERLHGQGYSVSVLGVGTAQGAPVSLPGGGFVKDAGGAIILPKLDSAPLQAVATAGGGRYQPVATDNSDVQALAWIFEQQSVPGADGPGQIRLEQWRDLGPWLLLPLLPLAALAFRRGLLGVALLTLLLPWPDDAAAWEWQDLWRTPDQQAQQAMQRQDYGAAAERFLDPAWKGAAYYRAGLYDKAAAALAGLDDAESLYNRGNALAQGGKYQDAIAAYAQALKKAPDHADARHNKDEVEKLLKRQEHDQNSQGQKGQNQSRGAQDQEQEDKRNGEQGNRQPPEQDKGEDQEEKENQDQPQQPQQNQGKQDQQPTQQPPPNQTGNEGERDRPAPSATADDKQTPDESQQANEAWLKRIPDDPGGLLKRKFQYQYQQRRRLPAKGNDSW